MAQINSDWSVTTGLSQILNKPTIPSAQINSDWNTTTGLAQILNKPTIPPTLTVGNGITIISNVINSLWRNPAIYTTFASVNTSERVRIGSLTEADSLLHLTGNSTNGTYFFLCVLLPLENLLWAKLQDYAVSRVNPNPSQVFLVRVVKM